jgi:hypothetical protein
MSRRGRFVAPLVVLLLATACGSHKHKAAEPSPVPPQSSTAAQPVTRTTVRASTTLPSRNVTLPTITLPTITLPPPFTAAQLELALLQSGDVPLDSQRVVVPPSAWSGVCGSSPPSTASAISAAAVDFVGPHGLHVREDLADYGGAAAGYLDAVRAKVACATYALDAPTGPPMKVLPLPEPFITGGIDTSTGATGLGVATVDGQGRVSYHVWVRKGGVVISMQDDARTATAVSAVQLAQLALERVRTTLG